MLIYRADLDFDLLGSTLTDGNVVFSTHVAHNRLIKAVTRNLDRLGNDDAAERHHRDLGRTAADIDNHMSRRAENIKSRAKRRRYGLCHQIGLSGACLRACVHHRALLHLRNIGRHADHHARTHHGVSARAANKELDHLLGHVVAIDHTVAQRSDDFNMIRISSKHHLGILADPRNAVGIFIDRDHRGLVEHDPLPVHVNENACRAKINAKILGQHLFRFEIPHNFSPQNRVIFPDYLYYTGFS